MTEKLEKAGCSFKKKPDEGMCYTKQPDKKRVRFKKAETHLWNNTLIDHLHLIISSILVSFFLSFVCIFTTYRIKKNTHTHTIQQPPKISIYIILRIYYTTIIGRMKGLAFVYDPDGYWVELVKRGDDCTSIENECNFSQTMLRVKDPKKSLEFYQKLGMKVLIEKHFDDFSLYFLGSSVVNDNDIPNMMFQPCLELTHNHGTESNDEFKHYNGNEDDRKGFGHIGFLVDDVYKACDAIGKMGYGFKKVRFFVFFVFILIFFKPQLY